MANPPFNVDKVDKAKLAVPERFSFGLPKPDNANYLWIQEFYSALNETGRAGFVMANSAGDSGTPSVTSDEQVIAYCAAHGVDLPAVRDAQGFSHIALRDSAVEARLVDEATWTTFMTGARHVRKLFKALLPNLEAAAHERTVAAIRVVAERISDVTRAPRPDIADVADAVEQHEKSSAIPTGPLDVN